MSAVSWAALTDRNAGFLGDAERAHLRRSSVFVCGVGGMGGVAVETLVRSGVGALEIADFDVFEPSNLNRQPFARVSTLGRDKTEATRDGLLDINPELRVTTWGREWTQALDEILPRHAVVVNGMDDPTAAVALYRAARRHGATVVDAFVSPHPSVTCVRPGDPRPEEWLASPTRSVPLADLDAGILAGALLSELSYVAAVSRGLRRLPPGLVAQVLRGERPRSSFAPVVAIAGNLMAFEAMRALLGYASGAGYRGYFLDPWSGRVERPAPAPVLALRRRSAARWLERLCGRSDS